MSTPLTTAQWIKYSFIGVCLIIGGIFLWRIFHKAKPFDESVYKEQISIRDSLLASKEETIKALQQVNIELDKNIMLHFKNDSLLKGQTIIINHKYEAIPVHIGNLSKDSLRSIIANY